jgi:hypothetical protein
MSELDAVVNDLIRKYKEAYAISETPRVLQIPLKSSGRSGAYDVEKQNESAEVLLYQLAKLAKGGAEEPERGRLEVEAPPMLIIAKRVKSFLMFFCGFRNDKAVWCYGTDHLAQRFNFNQAKEISAQLGEGVYALPAPERRKAARMSSW